MRCSISRHACINLLDSNTGGSMEHAHEAQDAGFLSVSQVSQGETVLEQGDTSSVYWPRTCSKASELDWCTRWCSSTAIKRAPECLKPLMLPDGQLIFHVVSLRNKLSRSRTLASTDIRWRSQCCMPTFSLLQTGGCSGALVTTSSSSTSPPRHARTPRA